MALQEKLEEIKQRDELICELEDELTEKELTVERLKQEVRKLRALMSGNTYSTTGHQAPRLSVPSTGANRIIQGRSGSGAGTYFSQHQQQQQRPPDAIGKGGPYGQPTIASVGQQLPRFKLPQPGSSSLRTRMGLVKTFSNEPSNMTSSSSGESAESGHNASG